MSCSRRQFITGVGALVAVSGTAGRVVAKTLDCHSDQRNNPNFNPASVPLLKEHP